MPDNKPPDSQFSTKSNSPAEMAKDLRIDRIVTWFLMLVVTLGIGIAGHTYRTLTNQIEGLNNTLNNLNTTVAVMQAQFVDVGELKNKVHALEIWKARTEGNKQ